MSTYVPLDIQFRIIQQRLLPIKSLIRFISVCKAWKSFITSSEFVVGYGYHHTQPQHLMIKYDVEENYSEDVKFVCFFREPDGSSKNMAVLWNPLIRKSIAIDLPPVELSEFDFVVGFGVCPQTNDPKLVQITYIYDNKKIESISCIPNQVMVFTLSSGEWRYLSSNQLPRKSIEFDQRCSRVIGQFIYWLAYDRTDEDVQESLAVVKFSAHTPLEPYVVWTMEMENDDPKSLTKLFSIQAPHASINRIVGFSNNDEPILESLEVDHQDSDEVCQLVVYEPFSGHIKHLGVRGNNYSFSAISYTESLLLLDHDDCRIISCGDVKKVGTILS
ncbi:hypothetical protein OSB04_028720 [Centaurea solstitialis]|uniref:F-box domain-containing protein n=1 Tax=Centaurea solstitialis TaxID=347529 RepID=A0AA38SHU1_9ASTR|nr:hypothetical protein OSB04_028720 [Centaurea solstitialis]